MTGPIARHRGIESPETAARWPGAGRAITVALATRLAVSVVPRRPPAACDDVREWAAGRLVRE